MKEEDKILDELFETARNEPSQIPFEQMANSFLSATSTPTLLSITKSWLFKNISLNSLAFLIISSGTLVMFWGAFTNSNENNFIENKTSPVTNTLPESSFEKEDNKQAQHNYKALVISNLNIDKNKLILSSKGLEGNENEEKEQIITKKIQISESPKIHSITKYLQINSSSGISKYKIPSNVFTKKPRIIVFKEGPTTPSGKLVSPWVSGEGKTSPEWGFIDSRPFTHSMVRNETIQTFFDIQHLEKIFKKNKEGNYNHLTLVSNYFFPENILLHFQGDNLPITGESMKMRSKTSHEIIITKYKVRKNKAVMEYDYQDFHVIIKLKKVNHHWKPSFLKAKDSIGNSFRYKY